MLFQEYKSAWYIWPWKFKDLTNIVFHFQNLTMALANTVVWVPDERVRECHDCKQKFSGIRRRVCGIFSLFVEYYFVAIFSNTYQIECQTLFWTLKVVNYMYLKANRSSDLHLWHTISLSVFSVRSTAFLLHFLLLSICDCTHVYCLCILFEKIETF